MNFLEDIQMLNHSYFDWLQNKEVLRAINTQWVGITTPFLDRHNDCLEIYVKRIDNNNFVLTDDGYIIADLQMCGFDIDSPKRNAILHGILSGSRVKCIDNRLEISFSPTEFAQSKHNLIQAMLSINDMFYTSMGD